MQEEPSSTPPVWMIDLEKRLENIKQHRKLGHEVGAGSKCLKCLDACPGLELHYWRKRCISCKCKKEDHDVPPNENDLRFEILLYKDPQNSGKQSRSAKTELLHIMTKIPKTKTDDLKTILNETGPTDKTLWFDWVPPHVSKELAAEYMVQLPVNKMPICSSVGAVQRNLQLAKQIPLHDIDPSVWHKLPAEAQAGFQKYLQNVRDNVVGQGRVLKVCHKQYVAESSDQNLQQPQQSKNVRHDQSFPTNQQEDSAHYLDFRNRNLQPVWKPVSPRVPVVMRPKPLLAEISHLLPPRCLDPTPRFPAPLDDSLFLDNEKNGVNDLTRALAASHITNQKNPDVKNQNSECEEDKINEPLSSPKHDDKSSTCEDTTTTPSNPSGSFRGTIGENHDNVPEKSSVLGQNQPYQLNTQYGFDSHPTGYVPSTNVHANKPSDGRIQLPPSVPRYARTIQHDEDLRNANEQMEMHACAQCREVILTGSVAVVTDRAGPGVAWHPQCFVCNTCNELLVDLIYFFHKNKVYCGRHYAEIKKIPRCHACDELIFVNMYTMAEDKAYHVGHFCCAECEVELGGMKYVLSEDQTICLRCYETKYCKKCQSCGKIIKPDEQGVTIMDMHWHATGTCFHCNSCGNSLIGSRVVRRGGTLYCSRDCTVSAMEDVSYRAM